MGVPTILGVQPTGINRGCPIFRLKAWDSLAQGNALGFWLQSCTLKGCDSETYAFVPVAALQAAARVTPHPGRCPSRLNVFESFVPQVKHGFSPRMRRPMVVTVLEVK